ncbi:mitochondrial carrier protein, amino-acid transporter arg-13 [Rhodotorula toruloides]|uniref:Mitochondrial carrier protein, amino-acid transporter arg-13 n=1 Tax=Rhodotorula toruloides TaxID=5286 RepID=A0A511KBU7_RHOTO|nr:mitochondrial carrier protein, amino-acid transporter arg-13 [Rhodotorula toruloides]
MGDYQQPPPHGEPVREWSSLKDILYGSAAGIVSKLFEHPFDLTKVRLQSQPLDRPLRFTGPWDCIVQTYRNEGVPAFWRGVSMPVVGAMAENATLFVVYNQSQTLLRRLFPPPPRLDPDSPAPLNIPLIATAAAIAGAATSFVLTPIELIKCKMQVSNIAAEGLAPAPAALAAAGVASTVTGPASPTKAPGSIAVTRTVLREYGLRGLWLGQTGTMIRETGGGAAWFGTFELLAAYFLKRRADRGERSATGGHVTKGDLSALELMAAGATAGVVFNVVLFPADCIKSTLQTEDELRGKEASRNQPRRGFLQVGKDIYRARGIRGLYSGCGLTALKAAPSSALIFYIYSRLEAMFG